MTERSQGWGSRRITLLLVVGLFFGLWLFVVGFGMPKLPGDHQGYEPDQPIAYSHRLHAGELGLDCMYCHKGADKSRHAGIPAASTCMKCHKNVTSSFGAFRAEDEAARKEGRPMRPIVSAELRKLYDALGLDEKLQPDPSRAARPIIWNKVHNLPDFVYFDHSAHVNKGVQCQTCHGPVQTMERMRQDADLSMGWCVNCHRDSNRTGVAGRPVNAPLDCAVCHH
jgi:hypothetical protein